MKKPIIYHFDKFSKFMADYLEWQKSRDPRFSLRWWAKKLDLKSHTFILKMISGQKYPSDELLDKILSVFQFSIDETVYAKLLAGAEAAKTDSERKFYSEKLHEIRKDFPSILLKLESFELISHWYSLAIFELANFPSFEGNVEWIANQFGGAIAKDAIEETLERLIKLGLLSRDENGRIKRIVDSFTTPHNIPSAAVRNFHREMLAKAMDAIEDVPHPKRFFFGHTLPVQSHKMAEAQDLIVEFRQRFQKLIANSDDGGSVYHLAIQFFPLTKV